MRFHFFLFFVIFLLHLEAEPLRVNVSSGSAILINAKTGAILYEKEAHIACQPASTTKIATALYALEKKGNALDEPVVASQEAMKMVHPRLRPEHPPYRLTSDGTMMGLRVGEINSLRDLMYGLMLPSGNDAANVIAEYVSGTIPAFVEELNHYLRGLGCKETQFCNPHGLPCPGHRSTAWDMALMTKRALSHPFFREVVRTVRYLRPQTNKQPPSWLLQHNKLIKRGPFFYPQSIGVKIGYTNAGATLVAAAEKEGRILIAALMNAKESRDHFQDAITLFEAAFTQKEVVRTLLTREHDQFTLPLKGIKEGLRASLSENLKITYFPAEEPSLKAFLKWDPVTLPLPKGARVGEIQLQTPQGEIFKTAPLYATENVEAPLSLLQLVAKKGVLILFIGVAVGLTSLVLRVRKRSNHRV
jgi:serine-type D-Ala-D-Ala carboxypeptidase (penicillin-binding protein 5/6)